MKTTYNPQFVRPYYYFIFGATGGVTGWLFIALLGRNALGTPPAGMQFVQGAILGSLIGLGGGIFDGLAARSTARIVRFGGTNMLLGLLAGCIAMPLVQAIYGSLRGEDKPGGALVLVTGVLCWVLFGGLIGFGEGISKGAQVWKGVLGGMAGGAIGGGLYELVGRPVSRLGDARAEQLALALAMLLLGGSIGLAVALVSIIFRDAWLIVENGKLKGYELAISKYVDKEMGSRKPGIIGSKDNVEIYLPGDPGVLPRHASIGYADGVPTLTVMPEARRQKAITRVNGRSVSTSWPLTSGDHIQIGATQLVYRHKMAGKTSSRV